MRYEIRAALGRLKGSIDISAQEFEEIRAARAGFVIAVGFEEKFNLLLENYLEFERTLLDLTLRELVFAETDWASFQDNIVTVNRCLANLLSAARLYNDQVDHELAHLLDTTFEGVAAVRKARSAQYDERLGYRVLDAMRNFLQHRGFPVHQLAVRMAGDVVGDQTFVEHTITPSISAVELQKEGALKPAIQAELDAIGPLVPLTPLVRQYVEGLARVQETLRAEIADYVGRWERTLASAMERARRELGEDRLGFLAVEVDATGHEVQEMQLFADLIQRRQVLQRRTRHAASLANHYVSGLPAERDA